MAIHPLTSIENEIVVEICRYLAVRASSSEEVGSVIGILGSWGHDLAEKEVFEALRAINVEAIPNTPLRIDGLTPRIFKRSS
jgi:hypothetical protein